MSKENKPGRTLGLSLAIILSVLIFTIIPLLQVWAVVTVQGRIRNVSVEVDGEEQVLFSGGDVGDMSNFDIGLRALTATAFLLIAIFAWIGRPRSIRFVFVAAVILLTLISLFEPLRVLFDQPSPEEGLASASLSEILAVPQIVGTLLVTLYVVWYTNRGPARAFYRGYYLTPPDADSTEPA